MLLNAVQSSFILPNCFDLFSSAMFMRWFLQTNDSDKRPQEHFFIVWVIELTPPTQAPLPLNLQPISIDKKTALFLKIEKKTLTIT